MKKINKKNLIIIFLTVVLLIMSYFVYKSYFYDKNLNEQEIARKELSETIKDISKLMVLPEDEEPTLATVTDPKKLEGQTFFAKAKTGDKILIYTNSKKVILYSPSMNKIVEVGSLNLNN